MKILEEYIDDLNYYCKDLPILQSVSGKLPVQDRYVSLVFLGSFLFCMVFGIGANLICDLICILYPSYMSVKSIQRKSEADYKQWATYWVMYALYSAVDQLSEILLFWLPFYFCVKLIVLAVLFHPRAQGASLFYDLAVKPALKKPQRSPDQLKLNERMILLVISLK